jgi:hypothetical protein
MPKTITKNQLYRVLMVLVLVIFCTSCEKEVPLGTLTASVDGNKRVFDGDPKAEWTSDPEGYELWIHGVGVLNEVSIRISSQTLITARTYNNSSISFYRYVLFIPIEYSTTSGYVDIIEMDGTHVQGTFRGTLNGSEGSTVVLSKGVFNLSL